MDVKKEKGGPFWGSGSWTRTFHMQPGGANNRIDFDIAGHGHVIAPNTHSLLLFIQWGAVEVIPNLQLHVTYASRETQKIIYLLEKMADEMDVLTSLMNLK